MGNSFENIDLVILNNKNMPKFEDYEEEFKILLPDYTEEKLREVFELRVQFWRWIVENFDLFYDQQNKD